MDTFRWLTLGALAGHFGSHFLTNIPGSLFITPQLYDAILAVLGIGVLLVAAAKRS
jgi:hypothetical protein